MPQRKVVQMAAGSPPFMPQIPQAKLDIRYHLSNRLNYYQEQLRLLDAELLSQLRAGATVEPGPHMARVRVIERGGKYVELLEVS